MNSILPGHAADTRGGSPMHLKYTATWGRSQKGQWLFARGFIFSPAKEVTAPLLPNVASCLHPCPAEVSWVLNDKGQSSGSSTSDNPSAHCHPDEWCYGHLSTEVKT